MKLQFCHACFYLYMHSNKIKKKSKKILFDSGEIEMQDALPKKKNKCSHSSHSELEWYWSLI